ncbi:hypothetical protein GJV04_19070 [Enterobacteriaceae bacterium RIT714]|nr:hypothetical protein [Enterobacteriaceae bacterium RIT714]
MMLKRLNSVAEVTDINRITQKAAEITSRIRLSFPTFWNALHAQDLEVMYFLIEPLFIRANALKVRNTSDREIADIITRMIR